MFENIINNTDNSDLGENGKFRISCRANGCPLGYRLSAEDFANTSYICDFHRTESMDEWQGITRRIRANKWLFDIDNFCRVREYWHTRRFEPEEKDYINSIALDHNCEALVISGDYDPRCFEYEKRLFNVQYQIVVKGKYPDEVVFREAGEESEETEEPEIETENEPFPDDDFPC